MLVNVLLTSVEYFFFPAGLGSNKSTSDDLIHIAKEISKLVGSGNAVFSSNTKPLKST